MRRNLREMGGTKKEKKKDGKKQKGVILYCFMGGTRGRVKEDERKGRSHVLQLYEREEGKKERKKES